MLKKTAADNEGGMALVACLLIMMLLAMIGVGITTDSTIEIKIAGNQKDKVVSFQNSDAATTAAPEFIEDNLDHPRGTVPYVYSGSGADPVITVYKDNFAELSNDDNKDPRDPANDWITMIGTDDAGDINQPMRATVNVTAYGRYAAGSAIQMAAGYEGVGKSAASGGYHAFYRCRGREQQGSTNSFTEVYYRHIPR